jgi:hypothetical protein
MYQWALCKPSTRAWNYNHTVKLFCITMYGNIKVYMYIISVQCIHVFRCILFCDRKSSWLVIVVQYDILYTVLFTHPILSHACFIYAFHRHKWYMRVRFTVYKVTLIIKRWCRHKQVFSPQRLFQRYSLLFSGLDTDLLSPGPTSSTGQLFLTTVFPSYFNYM